MQATLAIYPVSLPIPHQFPDIWHFWVHPIGPHISSLCPVYLDFPSGLRDLALPKAKMKKEMRKHFELFDTRSLVLFSFGFPNPIPASSSKIFHLSLFLTQMMVFLFVFLHLFVYLSATFAGFLLISMNHA